MQIQIFPRSDKLVKGARLIIEVSGEESKGVREELEGVKEGDCSGRLSR